MVSVPGHHDDQAHGPAYPLRLHRLPRLPHGRDGRQVSATHQKIAEINKSLNAKLSHATSAPEWKNRASLDPFFLKDNVSELSGWVTVPAS